MEIVSTEKHETGTSADETDGAEEPRLGVVHLQRQKLTSEGKHQICERAEAGVVHLSSVESQAIRERHRILFWGVAGAYPQHLLPRAYKKAERNNKKNF